MCLMFGCVRVSFSFLVFFFFHFFLLSAIPLLRIRYVNPKETTNQHAHTYTHMNSRKRAVLAVRELGLKARC